MKERHTPQELVDRLAQAGALPAGVALDRGQAEVIGSPLGSALVLAGAGSGKTFVMALRVVYLVANGLVAPEQILGLTFTRKAAAELGDRISWMLSHLPAEMAGGEDAGQPVTSTYNAYAAGIVRDHGLQLGVDPDARVLTEAQKWELGSQVVEAWDGVEHLPDAVPPRPGAPPVGGILAGPPPWPAASTLTRELLTLADQCSDNRVGGEAFAAEVTRIIEGLTRRRDPVLAVGGKRKISATPQVAKQAAGHLAKQLWAGQLISAYTLRKTEAGVMDFADQVAAAKRIAELEGGSAAKAESAVYKAVLLDEFQDTSVLQIEFLRALFGQTAVMAVGDPNQAIYGWRGASVGAMPRFVDSFRGPPGVAGPAVFTLNTARRNDRAILAAANRIVEPLRAELAALLGRRLGGDKPFELPALAPRAEAGPGDIRSAYFATDVEEADYVAQYLREEWLGAGADTGSDAGADTGAAGAAGGGSGPGAGAAAGGAGAGSGPTGRTACVLVRARDQIPEIVRALEDARVPYRVAQSTGLLDVPEIRDLVSALIAGHDLDRGDAFMRLAASPRWGIGIADLDALRRAAAQRRDDSDPPGPLDLVDELAAGSRAALVPQLSEAGALRLADLGRALRRIRSASSRLTLPETVLAAERALNLDIDLLARDGTAGRSQVNRLVQEAHRYAQGQERATLAGFLGWLEQEEQVGDGLAQAEIAGGLSEVEIMTIHAAKGLERDVVVVPGLAEGRLPSCAPGPDGERRARAWLSSQKQSGGTGGLPWSLRLDRADLPQFEPGEAGDVIELRAACEEFLLRAGQHALTEDRRLMYVALTRAKTHLLLTGAWGAGARKGVREPSVFLSELAQESNGEPALLDSAGWAEPPAPADAGSGGVAGALDQPAPDAVAPGPAVPSLDAAGSATDAGSGGVAGALEQPAPDAVAPGSAVPSLDAAGGAEPLCPPGSGGAAVARENPEPTVDPVTWPPANPLGARAPAVEAAAARVRAAAAALPGLLAPAAPPGHLPPGAPPGPTAAAAALPGLLAPAAPPGPLPPGAPPGPTADAAAPGPLAPAHGAGSEHAAAGTPRLTEDQALDLLAQIDDDLAREAALLLAEERLAGELPRVALPEQTSATGLVALAQDPVGQAIQLRRPIPRQPSGGAAIGAQFHARVALELAHHWGARAQQGVLDEDALAAPAVDAELEAAVGRLLAAWRESEWLSGRYRVSAVEAPIELDFMGHAVAARIDAVFEDRDGSLVVVDWKTERSRGGRAKPSHAGQIRFYQAALARSRGIDPASIRGYVHHVPENLSLEVSYDPAYMERLAAMWTAPVST